MLKLLDSITSGTSLIRAQAGITIDWTKTDRQLDPMFGYTTFTYGQLERFYYLLFALFFHHIEFRYQRGGSLV